MILHALQCARLVSRTRLVRSKLRALPAVRRTRFWMLPFLAIRSLNVTCPIGPPKRVSRKRIAATNSPGHSHLSDPDQRESRCTKGPPVYRTNPIVTVRLKMRPVLQGGSLSHCTLQSWGTSFLTDPRSAFDRSVPSCWRPRRSGLTIMAYPTQEAKTLRRKKIPRGLRNDFAHTNETSASLQIKLRRLCEVFANGFGCLPPFRTD